MAPARKSRTNKRYTSATSYSPEKDVGNSNKTRQRGVVSFPPDKDAGNSNKSTQRKKKLSDKLGPRWSKEDLERFYDAYRKNGRDWKRVAAAVRNRSAEMVEALYSMNRAYLSLPEGTASVIGLIAMMTDHYNVLEGSESDYENNDASGLSTKHKKQKRGKDQPNTSRDPLQSYSNPSADGCLSSWLKRKRSDVAQPRVVGKRTPRVPVQHLQRKDYTETCVSPFKKSRKPVKDNEDEVAHAALVLAEASQRAGSPQVSTPYKRQEHLAPSPARSWERLVHQQTEKANSRRRDASGDDDWLEGSVGSRGAESGEYTKDSSSILEDVGTVEVHQMGRKFYRKNEKIEEDDGGEACSGTEGLNVSSVKGKHEVGVSNTRTERISPQIQRKRSKKLFFGDESSAFDALQTLANLSLMQPQCAMESDLSAQLKPEVILDNEDKFNAPEATSSSQVSRRNKVLGAKLKVSQEISGNEYTISKKSKFGKDSAVESNSASTMEGQPCSDTKLWKRKRKPFLSKKSGAEAHGDSPSSKAAKAEVNLEEESKPLFKGKRSCQTFTPSKQWKSIRSSEGSLNGDLRRAGPRTDLLVATTQLPASSQVNIPPKRNSRRKMNLPQTFDPSEMQSFENLKHKIARHSSSMKERLFSCLSSCLVRRWCTFEWFYSAIDYPWFAKREFEEYLNHVGLGHIPRLTRVEWGVIRSSLGKPRRFSEHFLHEERDKLKQYRESVRNHYVELRAGVREGLPTDLAKPLAVGQRVIALHPRTREVHDGSVLTVDHDKCRIQFDRPDIGVEFVMDVDCMPLNPLDNMPEVLRMQKSSTYKSSHLSKEPHMNGNLNFVGPTAFVSSGHVDKAQNPMNTMGMQGNGENAHTISQLKAAAINIVNARPGAYDNCFAPNNQSREADIRVISELTRALDKKETLLMELKKTNDEVSENQNNGDYSLRASEPFMKHYATVLVQLKEASGQVSSALHGLRQRNNYQGNVRFPWLKVPPRIGAHGGPPGLFETFSASQESSSNVVEILEGSKLKAQAMVDAAIKAFSSSNQGEDAYAKIREALECIDNKKLESKVLTNKAQEQVSENVGERISCKTEPGSTIDQTVCVDSNKMEIQIPAEVITSCVATLVMIKTCTERQYPPGDVAQILDSAVTSLHPCCPQNLQIYREIQTYMGRIKTQILALVPT